MLVIFIDEDMVTIDSVNLIVFWHYFGHSKLGSTFHWHVPCMVDIAFVHLFPVLDLLFILICNTFVFSHMLSVTALCIVCIYVQLMFVCIVWQQLLMWNETFSTCVLTVLTAIWPLLRFVELRYFLAFHCDRPIVLLCYCMVPFWGFVGVFRSCKFVSYHLEYYDAVGSMMQMACYL